MDQKSAMSTFDERIQLVNRAISLEETGKIPFVPFFSSVMQRLNGSSYKDIYYNYKQAGDATIKFYEQYPACDAHCFLGFTSGRANEAAGTSIIDWPGRPGTIVSDYSSHQVLEREFMAPEEYRELLDDYTGFMMRKYLPRVYSNLQGVSGITYTPTVVLSTSLLAPMYSPAALEVYKTLAEVAKLDADAAAASGEYNAKLAAMGLPPFFSGLSEAPFDILGDYFRGTVGLMMDLFEYEDEIIAACDMFADQQIAALQYFKTAPLPVKRVFFPLHKGMDGFMSPAQYEKLYWKPLKKIFMALIDMGVTPILYTEGRYNSRLEQLIDVPKGKVIYHFEDVDMKRAKEVVGKVACITGNLPVAMLEFGKKEQVSDYCKFLIDTCAPGGGYIFDFNGSLENTKKENLDAMFEAFAKYR
ncbi:Uroporphyrinogen decarboxylase (URO-D) [Sporobacter termitidis DSM 10068]|uniref:Uroporphyrinogen decarboxylase (URO-D) n=1 Tax=Sporobacter termitidis DSM 10068 TaxID=1123282 RepID=A0A1M5TD52_9FIRM|nr:uroporphyrinogen decarboxylase family protein [Sporobacter termitidis]SHH48611.1 Uroporphyrinogen decarboxylase (URO-D) [Sporobacter termitidis DSM 10068]